MGITVSKGLEIVKHYVMDHKVICIYEHINEGSSTLGGCILNSLLGVADIGSKNAVMVVGGMDTACAGNILGQLARHSRVEEGGMRVICSL